MKFGSLDVVLVNQIFSLTFDGPNGLKSLGAGDDLKAFVEGRIGSRMSSPALEAALEELKELGEAHDWDFAAMGLPAKSA